MDLSIKKCVPCEGGIPPLNDNEISDFKKEISDNDFILAAKIDKI